MNCSIAQEMLGPFFDSELDANAELQVREHLASCETCRAALTRLEILRRTIRNGRLSYEAPAHLEMRIHKSISSDRQTPRNWRLASGVAAAVLLAIALSIQLTWQRTIAQSQLDEAISTHVRAMITNHTTDVVSTDRHTVKPWFNGRIDFSPPVPDLTQQGFPLTGGRIDYLGGRPVATLVYKRRQHLIDLFVWPVKPGDARGYESSKGYNVIRWTDGGMSFVAVSDLNKTELEQFRTLLGVIH